MKNDLHQEWMNNPTGKIETGTICPHCATFNARNVACLALAINQENQVLLILRKYEPMKDYWAIPGGYLDWNETTEECAVRELNEETGLNGKITKLFNVYSQTDIDHDGRQNVAIFYLVSATGEIKPGDDAIEAKWFDIQKLPEKIAFNHRDVINEYLEK